MDSLSLNASRGFRGSGARKARMNPKMRVSKYPMVPGTLSTIKSRSLMRLQCNFNGVKLLRIDRVALDISRRVLARRRLCNKRWALNYEFRARHLTHSIPHGFE